MTLDNLLKALDEDVLYKFEDVEITTRVARFANVTYQVANIGSTAIYVRRKLNSFAILLFVIALGLGAHAVNLNSQYSDQTPVVAGASIVLAIAAIAVQLIWPKLISTLIIKMSSNDDHKMESTRGDHLIAIHGALQQAFIRRT